jgi:hypothetical protein
MPGWGSPGAVSLCTAKGYTAAIAETQPFLESLANDR